MKKKIAIILPYKEIYSPTLAGAASIWVKDYNKKSSLKNETIIYGNLPSKLKPISNNFFNIKLKKSIFSKNKEYIEEINTARYGTYGRGIWDYKFDYDPTLSLGT